MLYFVLVVGRDALQTADRYGFLVDSPASAGRFARAVARPAQNSWEDVRVPIDHVSLGIPALCYQPNILRYRSVRGTRILTIDNLMKILWIANVGRVHWFISSGRTNRDVSQ
jgi:hypothetical protein